MLTAKGELDSASLEFIEAMGLVYQEDGLPRIAGRIVALLTIRSTALSLQELSESLLVSRGSISTNTRLLEDFGMLERIGRAGDRQGFYQLTVDPYSSGLRGAIQRLTKAHHVVKTARDRIPKSATAAHRNLADMAHFYGVTVKGLEEIVKRMTKA